MAGRFYKWGLLGLLCCSFFFHQADRALFGLLTIPIQNDLHLTDTQIGPVTTALMVVAAWAFAGMSAWSCRASGAVGYDFLAVAIMVAASAAAITRRLGVVQIVFLSAAVAVAGRAVAVFVAGS